MKITTVMTAAEVASTLRVSIPSARRLMRTSAIRSFRVGERCIRTTNEAVADYLHQQQASGTDTESSS